MSSAPWLTHRSSGRIRTPRAEKGDPKQCFGRSRGGFSTKVHAVTTTGGKPLHVALTLGQQHESTMAEELLVHSEGDAFIADTGHDADRIRANVRKLRM
nr:transposase [Myxococcus sp. AB056]